MPQLNRKQLQAVEATEGKVRVVAGAGSGKTRVLAHRFAYLVNDLGISPGNILCLTFTNKAAQEMKRRIATMVDRGSVNDFVCTIHSFCVKFLRKEIYRIGYPKNFLVIDEDDCKALAKQAMQEFGIDRKKTTAERFLKQVAGFKGMDPDAYILRHLYPGSSSECTPVENTLIVPEKFNTERVIHSDASTDIRRIGYYDILTKCFTPGGKEITNEKLIQQILSTPGRDIYCDQGSLFSIITDRLYGFDDCARWIKPHFADSLKAMCEERFNKYGDRFFWGTIGQYVINISREECLDDADTDGRGTPFVLETFIINGDHTLTRYLESFIAAEDGAISPLPFNDVTEIMSTKFGISNFDPYHNPDFYNTKSGIIPVYY